MNIKKWLVNHFDLNKSNKQPEPRKDIKPKVVTKAEELVGLFKDFCTEDNMRFAHSGLFGILEVTYASEIYTYKVKIFYKNDKILETIQIVHRVGTYGNITYANENRPPRTTVYNETYECMLNEYMDALRIARNERIAAINYNELKGRELRKFEETRF